MSFLTKATVQLGKCQVGSGTAQPCRQPAVVKIRGIPFCEVCAREQHAYFMIGELTETSRDPDDNDRWLVEGMLEERIRRIRRHHVVAGEQEEPSAAA